MTGRLLRRARPALGTLVEAGARADAAEEALLVEAAFNQAFLAIAEVESALSAFDPFSDIGRFNGAAAGESFQVRADTIEVLTAALQLAQESDGLFDVTQGTGPGDWSLTDGALRKHSATVRIDLGGIGKGHAVDRALEALRGALDSAPCWINAGGDLRVSGLDLPVSLRDEVGGGVRPWMVLSDGALASSWFGPGARSRLAGNHGVPARHVSVAAPRCLYSDALTKVVALSGRIDAKVLARHGAIAWVHR
jgi:thiamine biosynthesis lipoprotein